MRTWNPSDLTMSGINLKSLGTTTAGIKIPVGDFFQFSMHFLVTLTAGSPTTGLLSAGINLFTGAGGAIALVPVTGATAINTKVANGEIWTFGGAGSAVGPTGTKATIAECLKVTEFIQPFVEVTEVVDVVTTATLDVYLQGDGYNR